MTPPLIWATRPCHQNNSWQQQLDALGETVAFPLLDIVAVADEAGQQAIKNRIVDLDLYAHVIFVSQNAVAHAFTWIEDYWPQLPMRVKFYAIGAKTADAVRSHTLEVIECSDAMNSEGLLTAPSLQRVSGQKILICRGQGGRPKLADELEQRGARVDYCELYQRQLPKNATMTSKRINWRRPQLIPIFSGETLSNLTQVLPANADKARIHLIVPAQRVANLAHSAGFDSVWVAQNASEAAMLASTQQSLATLLTL